MKLDFTVKNVEEFWQNSQHIVSSLLTETKSVMEKEKKHRLVDNFFSVALLVGVACIVLGIVKNWTSLAIIGVTLGFIVFVYTKTSAVESRDILVKREFDKGVSLLSEGLPQLMSASFDSAIKVFFQFWWPLGPVFPRQYKEARKLLNDFRDVKYAVMTAYELLSLRILDYEKKPETLIIVYAKKDGSVERLFLESCCVFTQNVDIDESTMHFIDGRFLLMEKYIPKAGTEKKENGAGAEQDSDKRENSSECVWVSTPNYDFQSSCGKRLEIHGIFEHFDVCPYCLKKFKLVKLYQKESDALENARNGKNTDKRGM